MSQIFQIKTEIEADLAGFVEAMAVRLLELEKKVHTLEFPTE